MTTWLGLTFFLRWWDRLWKILLCQNLKVWLTQQNDLPMDGLSGVGARDATASKNSLNVKNQFLQINIPFTCLSLFCYVTHPPLIILFHSRLQRCSGAFPYGHWMSTSNGKAPHVWLYRIPPTLALSVCSNTPIRDWAGHQIVLLCPPWPGSWSHHQCALSIFAMYAGKKSSRNCIFRVILKHYNYHNKH